MLVLSRKTNQTIHLGNDIKLTVIKVQGERIQIGIDAPPHVRILRGELFEFDGANNSENNMTIPMSEFDADSTRASDSALLSIIG